MRVLVTRPQADAVGLTAALAARGHDVVLEPLLTIQAREAVDWPVGHEAAQALLVTSANGVRAFAATDSRRDLRVYAVGDASAATARSLGFRSVESAAGDVVDLAALVAARLEPTAGPLLHPAAGVLAGDLQGALVTAGFTVLRVVLYDAEPVRQLSTDCRRFLNEGLIDVVTFFSPRTAASFASLVTAADLSQACRRIAAVCLSPAVADHIGAHSWAQVLVADRPEQAALLAVVDRLANEKS